MEIPDHPNESFPENNYIEADYRTVGLCKDFLKDYENVNKMHLYNPFSGRRIKRGTSTFTNIYLSVKKYLQNLDDEEFHSPIKEVSIQVRHVEPEFHLQSDFDFEMHDDKISKDWNEKAKLKLKDILIQQEKQEKIDSQKELYQWRNDLVYFESDFETKKAVWMTKNPELYSFFDHFKPQVLENKFLMEHVFLYEDHANSFIDYLQNAAKIFLNKDYGYGHNRPLTEKRYAPAMIMFWIYADFIKNARKFIKKNSKKLTDYLTSKGTQVRISKNNLNSLLFAYFVSYTKPETLSLAKQDYEKYFDDLMKLFLEWCNRESIYAKIYYRSLFWDFMASRVKPFRYISLNYDDFDNFDKIIDYVSQPIPVPVDSDEEI